MSLENPTPPALIRVPVRIVVLVAVLPVRMAWDALAAGGRLLDRALLRPAGRGLEWFFDHAVVLPARWLHRRLLAPAGRGIAIGAGWLGRGLEWLLRAAFVWPWRYVVVPVARYGVAVPAGWLYRRVLSPLGAGCLFLLEKLVLVPLAALFRHVLAPLFRYGAAAPAVWLYRRVLVPLGEGLGRAFRQAGRGLGRLLPRLGLALFVWPWAGLWRYVVAPAVRYGIVLPAGWLWKRVLAPVGREARDALALCWRVAGFVSRAVGRGLKWLAWNLLGRPLVHVWHGLRWCGRHLVARPAARIRASVLRPAGHWVRDALWAPARRAAVEAGHAAKDALASARAAVRKARRDARRALVGAARPVEPREPVAARARTLGSTTNVSGAVPAPEISLRKRG
ncbi:hypothetical protein ACIGW0_04825 [Streptomyces bikiniensis]|uniref:Integral membrane protein n=1 Tax=Streptomyces bikiniensis TaxID=1896 RepID=A0ABW8CME6_STRBI